MGRLFQMTHFPAQNIQDSLPARYIFHTFQIFKAKLFPCSGWKSTMPETARLKDQAHRGIQCLSLLVPCCQNVASKEATIKPMNLIQALIGGHTLEPKDLGTKVERHNLPQGKKLLDRVIYNVRPRYSNR